MAGCGQCVKVEPDCDVMDSIVKKEVINEEMHSVKEETMYDDNSDTSEAVLAELYADHVVKDELVLGPERPHRPDVGFVVRGIVKMEMKLTDEAMPSVKVESVYDDGAVTSEAALAELYADHVVKDELVLGPERPRRPDVGLVVRNCALGDADGCPRAWGRGEYLSSETTLMLAERASPPQKHKQFSELSGVKQHKLIHSGENPYPCEYCKKNFRRLSDLRVHERYHTCEKPYQCEVCEKIFSQLRHLISHKRSHTGEEPYQCEVCEKKFKHSGNLKIHKRTHTGEKPYQCEVCEEKFSRSDYLKLHKRSHTGEKPYQCEVCDKQFRTSSQLKVHKRSHTGEKPYQCDVCKKQFSDMSNINKHKLIHTSEKPYQCEVCEKKCTTVSQLKAHKRTHTSKKPSM
ncbi:zinc finger protein 625-like [Cydia pomonella]|uniref:zinc finger protein 625-like n=1 Tax=Cydia pomonella TaxID=82600 RepID=UPI002ADDDBEF|nr:zinc finger protein 625-like [Cydia pomonella]